MFWILTAACAGVAFLAFLTPWVLLSLVPAAAFGWIALVLTMAQYRFSDGGGRYQKRIHDLLRTRAHGNRILDIGCGNGHLAIQLAKDFPQRRVTGLDFWGSAWEYSKLTCERNAALEGVAERVTFVQGSAASLPFADGEFDCVVSCLTFHEVRDLKDKTAALNEALRVLRPGGTFAFLDVFSDTGPYPHQGLIAERLQDGRAVNVSDQHLGALIPLPFPLNGKRVLKYARVIWGEKSPQAERTESAAVASIPGTGAS